MATFSTNAGSFLFPLWGTGAKNGESVSIKYLSFGTILAHSWISCAFGESHYTAKTDVKSKI